MSSGGEAVFRALETPLLGLGALTAAWLSVSCVWRLLSGIRVWVLGNGRLVSPGKLGPWAVVTGATDGIGKAYAEELARRGFSIVLISRSQEKLDDVSKAISSKCGVETKTIAADFSAVDIYAKIEEGLAGLEIGVLVNNVGISYSYPEFFLNLPDLDTFIDTMVNVNITSVCQMTRLVLPQMVERKKGAVLNISSGSGMYPVPLLTVYSASKAFVDFFSRGLQAEYKSKGIIIQSVLPFFVATKLSKIRRATLDKPSPQRYVAAELNTVGLQTQTNGYLPHAIMGKSRFREGNGSENLIGAAVATSYKGAWYQLISSPFTAFILCQQLLTPLSEGLGDYGSAACQDPQQLLDGDGLVPTRPLPQEAEAGVDGLSDRRRHHHHHHRRRHEPRGGDVTVSHKTSLSPLSSLLSPLSDTPTHRLREAASGHGCLYTEG
uniref:Hydroxysteroid (17-beta) dehydrogenase 12b n=1 Tax=Scophthalmus maximus TaxID=52904 RepID=A0A8D3A8M0_SCOMX